MNRRITVQTGEDKDMDPICNITESKRAGGMAQIVECPRT
jgi:hypothetical protein